MLPVLVVVAVSVLGCLLPAAATAFDDATIREAAANLSIHLLSHPVSTQKIAPTVSSLSPLAQVHVDLDVALVFLVGVDDSQQTVTSMVQVTARWSDPALSWNASDHSNVSSVQLPGSALWTPPVFVANSLDVSTVIWKDSPLDVSSNGAVTSRCVVTLVTTCNMDYTRFPYDQQTCSMVFLALHPQVVLNITRCGLIPTQQSGSIFKNQWDVMGMRASSSVLAVLDMKRKSLFYSVCLFAPLVLTSYMNTLVFLVPLESGEKISFLISVFVFNSIFTGFFNEVMPRGLDSVPITMGLTLFVVGESFLVLVITLFIMSRHHNGVMPSSDAAQKNVKTGGQDKDKHYENRKRDYEQDPTSDKSNSSDPQKAHCVSICIAYCKLPLWKIGILGSDDAENSQTEKEIKSPKQKAGKLGLHVTPHLLDRLCFFVFFSVNSLVLCILFSLLF